MKIRFLSLLPSFLAPGCSSGLSPSHLALPAPVPFSCSQILFPFLSPVFHPLLSLAPLPDCVIWFSCLGSNSAPFSNNVTTSCVLRGPVPLLYPWLPCARLPSSCLLFTQCFCLPHPRQAAHTQCPAGVGKTWLPCILTLGLGSEGSPWMDPSQRGMFETGKGTVIQRLRIKRCPPFYAVGQVYWMEMIWGLSSRRS